jgi:hypothetical protein
MPGTFNQHNYEGIRLKMARFFDLHDTGEKKYIFNSFMIFVALMEIIILVATVIWQIDEGWFGGEVKVIPFPWKEYLVVSSLAPIVMIFLFGMIIRGFDLLNTPASQDTPAGGKLWRRLCHKCSLVSYLFGIAFLCAFFYGLIYPEKVLLYLKSLFSALGLWGTYVVIGIMALSMLYFPISLLLRYRLAKKAMEYQYLLTLAERHGVIFDQATGRLISSPANGDPPVLPDSGNPDGTLPLLDLDHSDSR